MAFCDKCGTQIDNGTQFCPSCGAKQGGYQAQANGSAPGNSYQAPVSDDVSRNKVMAVLAYIGILFLVPLLAAKDSPFARFHVNQGLVLFIFELGCSIALSVLSAVFVGILWPLSVLLSVVSGLAGIFWLVLVIIGIINAAQGTTKELPLIGKIRILK